MARSVGSIQIDVDTDTGRLKAKLTKDGKIAGKAAAKAIEDEIDDLQAKVNLETAEAKAAAKLLRKQLEAAFEGVPVDLDFDRARALLREFELQAEFKKISLGVEISDTDLAKANTDLTFLQIKAEQDAIQMRIDANMVFAEAKVEAFRLNEEAEALRLEVEAETAAATLELFAFREKTEADAIQAQVDLDTLRAQTKFDQLRLIAMATELGIDVDADLTQAELDLIRFRRSQEANDIEIEVRTKEAKGGGRVLSGGFDQTRLALEAILIMGDALAAGLSGSIAAATAVMSSGITAVGSAAGAAAPLVAAFGQGLTAIVVGSQGVGTALGAINEEFAAARAEGRQMSLMTGEVGEAMRNLAPSARATATAFAELRDDFSQVRLDVQQELFSGLSDTLRNLGDTALQSVSDGLLLAADSANAFAKEVAAIAERTDFTAIFEGLDPALDDLFDTAEALIGSLEPFLIAAAPAAERLAEMFERGATALQTWLLSSPDELATFLDEGVTSLQRWVDLTGSVGDLLATVFSAGQASGDTFLVSLNNMIERWDHFLESDPDALSRFFESGRTAMDAFRPVFDGLREAFEILVTDEAMGQFGELGAAIGDMLPMIAQLLDLFGQLEIASAFSNVLQVLKPVFALIESMGPEFLSLVGTFVVLTRTINLASAAMKAFSSSTPTMFAVTAALTAGIAIWDHFANANQAAEQQTRALSASLDDQVDILLSSTEAVNAATAGVDAFNATLSEGTNFSGEKIRNAFAVINEGAGEVTLGVADIRDTLVALEDDPVAALTSLGEAYGLPTDAAAELAEMVAKTDDNFDKAHVTNMQLGDDFERLAEQTGIPKESLIALAQSLEELQDQQENTDVQKIARDFLTLASTGSEAEQEMFALAVETTGVGLAADNVIPLYDKYVELVASSVREADKAAQANIDQAASYVLVNQAIEDAIAAHDAEIKALEEERDKAFQAFEAQEELKDATREAAREIATAQGVPRTVVNSFIDLGDAARDAADNASALKDSLDLLVTPALDAQGAADAFKQDIIDLNEAFLGGNEGIRAREEALKAQQAAQESGTAEDIEAQKVAENWAALIANNSRTLEDNTEVGLANREMVRQAAADMLETAAAQLAVGTNTEEVNKQFLAQRDALVNAIIPAFGGSRAEAEAYINQLNLTPDFISTLIQNPGMTNALLNAENLDLLYDDITGEPVIAQFREQGLDVTLADSEEFKTLVDTISGTTVSPTFEAPTLAPTETQVSELQTAAEALGELTVDPTITATTAVGVMTQLQAILEGLMAIDHSDVDAGISLPDYNVVNREISNLQRGLDDIEATHATANVTVANLQFSINKVKELDRELEGLRNRTITVTVNNVGGVDVPGDMTGALISGPTIRQLGEGGYAEAVIPLELPLNRVDPSVRAMAAILRGETPVAIDPNLRPIGKQVNVYQTITPAVADPAAVATQVLNRAAVLANM